MKNNGNEISTQTLAIMPIINNKDIYLYIIEFYSMLEEPPVSDKLPIHEVESNLFNKELKISDFFVH